MHSFSKRSRDALSLCTRPHAWSPRLLAAAIVFASSAAAAQDSVPEPAPLEVPVTETDAGSPAPTADEAADAGTVAAGLLPPTLISGPTPIFPEAASAAGLATGSVSVRVSIDAEGQVNAAEILEPQGYGFDEAARESALAHRFEPARRDGRPIASRIVLRLEFTRPEPVAVVPVAAEPPPPPSPPPSAPQTKEPARFDVRVHGHTEVERLRRSAEAVHVVETTQAKRQTADLGEVLARTQGVGVQRAGGLGSDTRFSLNGLTDDQVRFFLDGMPLEFAGYPFGIANVPVNLVERVEIYRGVVPIRFGADALGGAVNLVSDDRVRGTHASGSYQMGSFGTQRMTVSARHLHEPSGWFTRVNGFYDTADNDYPMNVDDVANAQGQNVRARVYRFHDGYTAGGANLETGVVGKSWADRLLVRGFFTQYDKEIQHNLLMTRIYGDIDLREFSGGATLRYENTFAHGLSVNAVAGYARGLMHYRDVGQCVYDWYGQCLRMRAQPGERRDRPQDQDYQNDGVYGRVNLEWRGLPQHTLRASLSPTFTGRTGQENRLANKNARDPLSAERNLYGLVSGLEYVVTLFDARLENSLFFKDYLQVLRSEEPLSNGAGFRRADRETHRFGWGDALRYTLAEWIYAKASYEWATRLPRADEIFGNAFPIGPNLHLKPEVSHNVNLGLTVDASDTPVGRLRGDINGFMRDAEDLIRVVGGDKDASYQNVYTARSLGVELAAGWTSKREWVALDGNFTYVDFRNTSTKGAFAANEGDRIPNRPYLFGNGSARLQAMNVASPRDQLSLAWTTRYVHEFLRGWDVGSTNKQGVPSQLLHSLALIYEVRNDDRALSFTGEVQNLTDQAAYDFFGVLRPGRAFYFKATGSL